MESDEIYNIVGRVERNAVMPFENKDFASPFVCTWDIHCN